MKSFIEVIKEADEVQARLKFIQDPKSSTKSIVGLTRNSNSVIKNAAEEELKRRRDSGDQEAGASVQPPKDPTMHSATTQVGGDSAQTETKTKEVEPNNIAPSKKGSKGREILNNLAKGKTITGDAPNAIELNPKYIIRADGIKEEKAPGKTVVFSFGRMNPPTIGHEKLVKAIEREAKSVGGTPRLYLSRTEGDAKNPLPYAKKSKFAKLAFPIVKDTPNNMMPAGFIGLLKHLEDQFDDAVIVVGSDRLANIKKLADRYNGTEYKYNTIKVVSAGERDPDEEGAAGMSASKMRQAVKDGNMAAFKAGLPSRLKGAAKTIFDELSKSLEEQFDYELDEAVLTLSQRLKRRQQFRRAKGKIRLGQRRALARKATSKTITKRSKRIAIKMMRKRILRGRKYQDLSYSSRAAVDRQVARRKTAIARIAKRIEPKLRQAEGRRRSGQGFKSISLSPAPKKKLKEELSRDNLIQVVTEMFSQIAEEVRIPLTGLEMATLRRKCNESNNSFETLRTVFDRGVASWYAGLREGSTPQQWGFARVNSFIANGRTRFTADRDLLEQEDPGKREKLAIISNKDTSAKQLAGYLRNQDKEIQDAAYKALEARGSSGDQEAGAALDKHEKETPKEEQPVQSTQPVQKPVMRTPKTSAGLASLLAGVLPKSEPLSSQEVETRAEKGDVGAMDKAVDAASKNLGIEPEELDKQSEEKPETPKASSLAVSFRTNKIKEQTEKLDQAVKQVSDQDKDTQKRVQLLSKHWGDFVKSKTNEERVEAVRKLAEYGLIEGHMGGDKIYLSHTTALDRKFLSGTSGNDITREMNRVIKREGIAIPMRGSSSDRVLADLSGKHNEAGVVADLFPSEENKKALNEVSERYKTAGGDVKVSDKQNKEASDQVRKHIEEMFPGAKITDCQQVGGIGKTALAALGIDPKVDPTDVIVKVKDKNGKEQLVKYSLKVYTDPNNITMKNSGTKNAGETYLGETGKEIDSKFAELKKKYPFGKNVDEATSTINKKNLKQEYLGHFSDTMAKLAKTPKGQDMIEKMWKDVHGCGNKVNTLITNKTTGKSEVKGEDYYCSPKRPLSVTYDGIKVVVNVADGKETLMQIDLKTESDGSAKLLFRHIKKKSKEMKESFVSFNNFIEESADKAVGNVPVISQKPIHHKASGHKYHMHHMINPDLALKHQVKHATQRFDRDVDSDIDQFDKPKSNFPDEVSVPTKGSTAKFFAKYKKEREHIHAGEPIDEKTITPTYTGDENSWYLDSYGNKVRVYSQSDLKHPEDVGEFLKNPTAEKDIGPMMSMKDFLKTQPEKKK